MIKRKEQITEKAVIIGLIVSILVFVLSIKVNPINTANGIQIGNIGNYGIDVVNKLRAALGH